MHLPLSSLLEDGSLRIGTVFAHTPQTPLADVLRVEESKFFEADEAFFILTASYLVHIKGIKSPRMVSRFKFKI